MLGAISELKMHKNVSAARPVISELSDTGSYFWVPAIAFILVVCSMQIAYSLLIFFTATVVTNVEKVSETEYYLSLIHI